MVMLKKFLCLFSGLAFIFSLAGISFSASATYSGGVWGGENNTQFHPGVPKSVRNEILRGQWRQAHPRLTPLQSAEQRFKTGDVEGAAKYLQYWNITSRMKNTSVGTQSGLTPHSEQKLYTPKD